jgi:hypothetical protein
MKLAGVERKEAEGVAQCWMERDGVERNVYEMPKVGDRHAGLLRTYQGKSTKEIERALRSYEHQVDLHR